MEMKSFSHILTKFNTQTQQSSKCLWQSCTIYATPGKVLDSRSHSNVSCTWMYLSNWVSLHIMCVSLWWQGSFANQQNFLCKFWSQLSVSLKILPSHYLTFFSFIQKRWGAHTAGNIRSKGLLRAVWIFLQVLSLIQGHSTVLQILHIILIKYS